MNTTHGRFAETVRCPLAGQVEPSPHVRAGVPVYWRRNSPAMQAYRRERKAYDVAARFEAEQERGRQQWRRQLCGTAMAILGRRLP